MPLYILHPAITLYIFLLVECFLEIYITSEPLDHDGDRENGYCKMPLIRCSSRIEELWSRFSISPKNQR